MALTPTDFADVTARGLFVSTYADASAVNESTLLGSGYVIDAKVTGAYADEAHTVNFPVFNASSVVAVDLPADGSPVSDSAAVTQTFVTENVSTKIIPFRYQKPSVRRAIGGEAGFLQRMGQHIGKTMGATMEDGLVKKAAAAAAAASTVISTYNTGNINRKAITTSATATWGASWLRADSCIVVHPDSYNDLINSTDYVSAASSSLRDLAGRPIETYCGMAIIVSDYVEVKSETVGGNTKDVYYNLLLKRGTLQYYTNPLILSESVHIPGSATTHEDWVFSFAMHSSQAYLATPIVVKTQAGVA